jgi:DNA-binding NarL/FixJ family response regulator
MTAPDAEVHLLEPYRFKRGPVHAVPSPAEGHTEAQNALRLAAMAADANGSSEVSLALLWRQLARGMSRVVDGFFSESRCYLVLALRTGQPATPALARRMEILEAVLGGVRQKNTAMDLGIAASTVAMNAKLALASLGVRCNPSRAHPLLILAARAVDESLVASARCSFFVGRDDQELRVIGLPRPEQCLSAVLPFAELEVASALVEGLTHKEIADRRVTSPRTVANQIGSVFRRLGVSGRNELIQRLLFNQPSGEPEPTAETLPPPQMAAEPELLLQPTGARRSA